jgi:RNA polymerase sigma factor (sigma-70 family)
MEQVMGTDFRKQDAASLVRLAAGGDKGAWEQLIDQHARLIWAVTRDFRLPDWDAADIAQTTWMRLIEHIHRIEHPERLASWLATTTRNECLRYIASRKRIVLAHEDAEFDGLIAGEAEIDEALLAAERAQAVREAIAALPRRWQLLMEMLMVDPPVSYAKISDALGLPVGSIGPTRGRCIARLRELMVQTEGDLAA